MEAGRKRLAQAAPKATRSVSQQPPGPRRRCWRPDKCLRARPHPSPKRQVRVEASPVDVRARPCLARRARGGQRRRMRRRNHWPAEVAGIYSGESSSRNKLLENHVHAFVRRLLVLVKRRGIQRRQVAWWHVALIRIQEPEHIVEENQFP